uniref:Uncharacterized protein n=1 Tax=Arundo donax TaxID=35708 RepID=A0A0A8ZWN2_ARUDO
MMKDKKGSLPDTWLYEDGLQNNNSPNQEKSDQGEIEENQDMIGKAEKKGRKKEVRWGPVLVEKRSRRIQNDGKTIMEKAQDLKKISNLEVHKEWQLVQHADDLEEDHSDAKKLAGVMSFSLNQRAGACCAGIGEASGKYNTAEHVTSWGWSPGDEEDAEMMKAHMYHKPNKISRLEMKPDDLVIDLQQDGRVRRFGYLGNEV